MTRFMFPNGYGASVVRNEYSYGGDQGLYEVAVINSNGELVYDTPITSDVIGWCSSDDVEKLLIAIQSL